MPEKLFYRISKPTNHGGGWRKETDFFPLRPGNLHQFEMGVKLCIRRKKNIILKKRILKRKVIFSLDLCESLENMSFWFILIVNREYPLHTIQNAQTLASSFSFFRNSEWLMTSHLFYKQSPQFHPFAFIQKAKQSKELIYFLET